VQCDKDGSFGGFRSDLVWRDPGPIKSNLCQRFVRFNHQFAAAFNDFLIVQIRLPLRQISQFFKLRFCGGSGYELVIVFETALGRLYIRYLNRPLG
jgi:hypothetical protein